MISLSETAACVNAAIEHSQLNSVRVNRNNLKQRPRSKLNYRAMPESVLTTRRAVSSESKRGKTTDYVEPHSRPTVNRLSKPSPHSKSRACHFSEADFLRPSNKWVKEYSDWLNTPAAALLAESVYSYMYPHCIEWGGGRAAKGWTLSLLQGIYHQDCYGARCYLLVAEQRGLKLSAQAIAAHTGQSLRERLKGILPPWSPAAKSVVLR
jgi:hypothetical protein